MQHTSGISWWFDQPENLIWCNKSLDLSVLACSLACSPEQLHAVGQLEGFASSTPTSSLSLVLGNNHTIRDL